MKTILLIGILFLSAELSIAQCTTTNATSCVCADGSSDCLLLPDITASWLGISDNGYIEYPQTGAGENFTNQGLDNGRLRVSGSTPNIGHGSFTVRGRDDNNERTFLCGNDTVFGVSATGEFTCPNGYPNPKQLLIQRIYKKNSNAMTYVDEYVGSMTYHPAHGHNHVDDWAVMTLRVQTADPDPRNWPIVGTGAKIGFCLMDYGQCGTNSGSTYYGHCRDDNTVYLGGNLLMNADFPNWNLGGGNYNCSVIEQGISSGWTDVYGKHLDGMWINVPPNTCNGDYFIVLEIDKNEVFIEENDDNNYTAVPVTLTQQLPTGTPSTPLITSDNSHYLCAGHEVELTASGGMSYLWSNGETTQTIETTLAGSYTCEVTSYCGVNTSDPFVINLISTDPPVLTGDTVCVTGAMTLSATGTGTVTWFDDMGILVGTGNTYTTPILNTTTTYYALNTNSYLDTLFAEPYTNGIGGGGFLASTQYEIFNSEVPFTLESVLVYSQGNGNMTIQLQDNTGAVLQTADVTLLTGQNVIDLAFSVPADSALRLVGTNITSGGIYRNNNSATYPYTEPGILSITGASAGASYFYYFYNWEISTTSSSCASDMVPVQAVVQSCAGIGENIAFKKSIKLIPNPNNGAFNLEFTTDYEGEVEIQMLNMIGKQVHTSTIVHKLGVNTWSYDEHGLAKGVYILNIHFEDKDYSTRLIIQ